MQGETIRVSITMGYQYVGNTGIDIPKELIEGKSYEEAREIAYQYAQEHIDDIPVASNAEYVPDSDTFELEDVDFEDAEISF